MIAYFLFFDVSNGKQAWLGFSKEFCHCNVIVYDGNDWINYDFDRYGIHGRVLDVPNGWHLIRGLKVIKSLSAMVCVDISKRIGVSWKPWWVRSCNELDRYLTGVDVGFTFNPRHLYNKLLRYNSKRNYEILYAWRRKRWDSLEATSQAEAKN